MHNSTHLQRNSQSKILFTLVGLLMMLPVWSQLNEGISINGPYQVPNGISYHKTVTESNPVSVARTQALINKMSAGRNACSNLSASYTGFSADAITAFEFAMTIWENSIESTVPVTINAEFIDLPSDVTASTAPNGYFTISGVGVPNTLYPRALAEAIQGSEIGGSGSLDLTVSINDEINFYYGLDANPPVDQIDFVTLILHNLGHGLGFIGFGITDGTTGSIRDSETGFPSIFDTFVENGSGTAILSFSDPSTDLHAQLTSDDLFINGSNATSVNSGNEPKTFAPNPFDFFKSYEHWDSAVFPPSNPNSLMTETVAPGQANHNPGDVTLGFFEDMGWVLCQTLSIESVALSDFKIIENPVDKQLTISFNNALNGTRMDVLIYDLSGKSVYTNQMLLENNRLVISNMNNLKPGVYFLSLSESNSRTSKSKKFIKN